MLISFSVENWMSFKELTTFSMVASKERQHGDRVPFLDKYKTKILPLAAIYGGNASGKTNFFKAINFVKNLVVQGTRPDNFISIEPFLLENACIKKPSRFSVELCVEENIYEFSFSCTREKIIEEKLIQITSFSEKIFYHRKDETIEFLSSLKNKKFLDFSFKGTRENQLFLTNSVSQNIKEFKPIYDWFNNNLVLIAPDSRFGEFEKYISEESPLYSPMNKLLSKLDTGIQRVCGEEYPFENIPLPATLKVKLQEELKEGSTVRLFLNENFIITRKAGELKAVKLIAFHLNKDGTETKFNIGQESDGSRRVIDLLPAFLDISDESSQKVYIIDELDRSLHALLTRQLLETYLKNCSGKSRSQLLITTHDLSLMSQDLLRRDEMWVAERDVNGASTLISFTEYKEIRYDKDIRKSYLEGRLGGIPRIVSSLPSLSKLEKKRNAK